ncbi:MAG: DUF1513 domain-containing protein [Spongiibacteraceae bacterium]|jgi:hypothetical protein|nr:DUF1513 domain-containing protein [Spongiibacteraceae bacterium]
MASALSRRQLLQWLGLMGAGAVLPCRPLALPAATGFAGATVDIAGQYATTVCDDRGGLLWQQPLPDRGHALALHPNGRWLAQCSRRPGYYLQLFERRDGTPLATIEAASGRYFNGHCLFGERLLYATETVAESGAGCIGIYDGAAGWQRVGEWDSGGLDPHDLRWSADGRLIVVANGGLLSHPETPGIKLNIATMESSLAWLDAHTGTIVAQPRLAPELHQLSLRHLAVDRRGEVAVAMQWEGAAMQRVPLVAVQHEVSGGLETLALPPALLRSLRQYCGSAAVDASGRLLAVSSPVGGVTFIWDLAAQQLVDEVRLPDGCGVAAAAQGFFLSSGRGQLCRWAVDGVVQLEAISGLQWDNHLLALPG